MTVSGGRSQEVVESVPGAPVPGGGYPGGAQQPSAEGVRYKYGPPTHQCPYGTISSPSGVRPIWLKCLDAPASTAGGTVVVTVTATDAATLLAQGSGITRQPPGDQVLISKDFIVYTSPDTQVLTTTVAGTPVTIHATPPPATPGTGATAQPPQPPPPEPRGPTRPSPTATPTPPRAQPPP
ncbi:hypothetical protein [Actinomyces procaprae]|uniref:hypothetical protein n=1 Tax=Actinomyces procaprae TaxID=2560010 RepID=UPI00195D283B|nr:hypothetical protein [Actinomyces procaprae]